jgi:HPr kinase/phosphorylase
MPNNTPTLTVENLLSPQAEQLKLSLVAGKGGLGRTITTSRIQKPGLALAGYTEHVHVDRLQVLGNTEMSYLATLPAARQTEVVDALFKTGALCLVVTKNLDVPALMADAANRAGVAVLRTSLLSSVFIRQVESYLENMLMVSTSIHGVLVDVFGIGILILGKSGIGKSEVAVELVMRGHRMVADDIVEVRRKGADSVVGSASPIIRHHMEIRGLGIINIKDLFGVSAVRDAKRIQMVVELVDWDPHEDYDRLGIEDRKFRILEVEVPLVVLPVRPGRSMTTIIEVAARNHLLKLQGHYSALEFQEKLALEIAQSTTQQAVGDEVE